MAFTMGADFLGIDKLLAEIDAQAQRILLGTGQFALGRAQHHAPVRRMFKGEHRPRKAAFPKNLRSEDGLIRQIVTRQDFDLFRRSRAPNHRVDIPGKRITGTANSWQPVFAYPGGRYTGDFRKIEETTAMRMDSETGKIRPATVGGRMIAHATWNQSQGEKAERVKDQTGEAELNSAGRYALKTGVGIHVRTIKEMHPVFGMRSVRVATLGGRLRSEINLTQPKKEGDTWWIYVVSPTPYARWQEFGSSRNRANPYLRPALYESRAELTRQALRWSKKKYTIAARVKKGTALYQMETALVGYDALIKATIVQAVKDKEITQRQGRAEVQELASQGTFTGFGLRSGQDR